MKTKPSPAKKSIKFNNGPRLKGGKLPASKVRKPVNQQTELTAYVVHDEYGNVVAITHDLVEAEARCSDLEEWEDDRLQDASVTKTTINLAPPEPEKTAKAFCVVGEIGEIVRITDDQREADIYREAYRTFYPECRPATVFKVTVTIPKN